MTKYQALIDEILRKEIQDGQIAGACALVRQGENVWYQNALGYADMERKLPMKQNTIFRLFSLTKPVTSAAVMLLAERGLIALQDPVGKYLSWFAKRKVWQPSGKVVDAECEITIYHLLHMLAGITGPGGTTEPGRRMEAVYRELIGKREQGQRISTEEYMRRIAQVPLMNQPGEKWMYGLAADVLGGVIEKVSGKRFGAFLRDELFEPLEMQDTGFYVPEAKKGRFARIYEWEETGQKLVPYNGSFLGVYYGEDVAFESGGAGLVSTVDDYSHFAEMLLGKGEYRGKRLLRPETVEYMTKDHLTGAQKRDYNWDSVEGYGYGCLMRVLKEHTRRTPNAELGEFGWDGWTGTYVSMAPRSRLTVLYFIQRCGAGTTDAVREIRKHTYERCALKENGDLT